MYVHLVDINLSVDIDEYSSLHFQDIRKKTKVSQMDTWTDGWMDGQCENSIPHHKQSLRGGGGINTRIKITATIFLI